MNLKTNVKSQAWKSWIEINMCKFEKNVRWVNLKIQEKLSRESHGVRSIRMYLRINVKSQALKKSWFDINPKKSKINMKVQVLKKSWVEIKLSLGKFMAWDLLSLAKVMARKKSAWDQYEWFRRFVKGQDLRWNQDKPSLEKPWHEINPN